MTLRGVITPAERSARALAEPTSAKILNIAIRFARELQAPLTVELFNAAYSCSCDFVYTPTFILNEALSIAEEKNILGKVPESDLYFY